jgi:release factor glutamine methyltransferase
MNIQAFRLQTRNLLSRIYTQAEARALTDELLLHFLGLQNFELITLGQQPIPDELMVQLRKAVTELLAYKPIQYITKRVSFLGRTFEVCPDVLIPRPETEELVTLVINQLKQQYDYNTNLHVLEIGTGSGCIAVSIALAFPSIKIYATDISIKALMVAKRNAIKMGVENIEFIEDDIFFPQWFPSEKVQCIVSNPPYIPPRFFDAVSDNVKYYEPAIALFTPDDNGIAYYQAIIAYSKKIGIKQVTKIFFEINNRIDYEKSITLEKCEFKYDINGLRRFWIINL